MAIQFNAPPQTKNGYNMGIGKSIIGRPETRFMRKCRWTIEFDWSPPSILRDAARGISARIDAGFDAIQGGKDAVGGAGSFIKKPSLGSAKSIVDGLSGIVDATERMVNGPQQKDHGMSAHLVHVASRPHVSFERTELIYGHETYYIPGRPTYDPIQLTIYDVAGQSELARWVYKIYNYGKRLKSGRMGETDLIKYNGYLTMWDGEGVAMQSWLLYGCWPFDIDFGDLDYASSDTADITVSMSFDNMELQYDRAKAGKGNLSVRSPGNFDTTNSSKPNGNFIDKIMDGGSGILGSLAGGLTSGGGGLL